ncbi:MAG: SDR family oxidoreductase, partial [Limisphaerales bacterium]
MSSRLKDKWILVTGASAGFGAATARAFAREGCNLLLGARRTERTQEVAEECKKLGAPSAHAHFLDVSKTSSVEEFAAWIRTVAKRVDVLINNAGGAHGIDPVATAKDADWEAMFEINVLGVLRVTRAI